VKNRSNLQGVINGDNLVVGSNHLWIVGPVSGIGSAHGVVVQKIIKLLRFPWQRCRSSCAYRFAFYPR